LCADGKFVTSDGKAHFRVVEVPDLRRPAGVFEVSSRRGKQFNTLIYAEVDPLTGAARDAVFMNPDDAAKMHLRNHERIALVNELGRLEGRVFFAPIAPGNLQVHWPEGNVILKRGVVDTLGGVPDYNAQVRVGESGSRLYGLGRFLKSEIRRPKSEKKSEIRNPNGKLAEYRKWRGCLPDCHPIANLKSLPCASLIARFIGLMSGCACRFAMALPP
jgi:anaerobic selenocysteine-containing dehydrogenase